MSLQSKFLIKECVEIREIDSYIGVAEKTIRPTIILH